MCAINLLIRDFNLEVNPGEMARHCRPTGVPENQRLSIFSLRFYDVTAGSISVDGHDIRNLSRQDIVNSLVWCFRMLAL